MSYTKVIRSYIAFPLIQAVFQIQLRMSSWFNLAFDIMHVLQGGTKK